jgi:hypothetical protein
MTDTQVRGLDPALCGNIGLPVARLAPQFEMAHTIDLDHTSPVSIGRLVGAYVPVRDRTEFWPMGRDDTLHGAPNVHFPYSHGLSIRMVRRVYHRGGLRQYEKRFGLRPSPSDKTPDEDSNNNKGLEKTLHTSTSFER